jgi:hypothetical protein
MGWYRTGTVQVTNGSAAIVGTGTAWTEAIEQGWAFLAPDGNLYEVLAVNSDTSITLATNYAGANDSGEAYAMFPTQGMVRSLTTQVLALINGFGSVLTGAGAGKFGDGSAATPGISFASDLDCGFYRIASNSMAWVVGGQERARIDAAGNMSFSGNVLLWATGGSERMRLDASGNLSIGNSAASRKLDVYGDSGIGVHPTTDNGVMTFSISSTTGQSIIDCYSGPYTSSLLVRANSTPGGATGTIAQFAAAGSGIGGLGIDGQGLTVYNAALMTGGAATTSTSPALSGLRAGFLSGSNEAFLEAVNASDASLSIRTKVTGAAPAVVARFNALGGMTLFNVVGVPGNGSIYMEGGALKFKGGSGTVTTLANP